MARLEIRRLKEHEEKFLLDLGFLPRHNSDSRFSYWELQNGLEPPISLHVPIIDAPTNLQGVLKLISQYGFMQGYRAAKKEVAEMFKSQIDLTIYGPVSDTDGKEEAY